MDQCAPYESKHPSLTHITKYEYTRLRGFRLEQLANGAIPYIHIPDVETCESDYSSEPMTLSEIENKQMSLADIFNKEAYAGVLPFQVGRAEQTFTTYRACMDKFGNMRTIELNCFEQPLPSAAARNEETSYMVILQPSATVEEAIAKLNEIRGAADTPATALILKGSGSSKPKLEGSATLWDYGIIENTDVYFE